MTLKMKPRRAVSQHVAVQNINPQLMGYSPPQNQLRPPEFPWIIPYLSAGTLVENKAVYTTTPVAGGWAGAVMSWVGAVMIWAGAFYLQIAQKRKKAKWERPTN